MSRFGRLGLLPPLLLSALLIVGCPIPNLSDGDGVSPGPRTPGSGVGSGGTGTEWWGGGGTVGSSTAADPLAQRFPGCSEPSFGDDLRDEVLDRMNLERRARGLELLRRNATLEAQADQYACEMIYYRFFAHENPVTGSTLAERVDEFGYEYLVIGENLAAGQRLPGEVVEAWMGSPGHRENILDGRFTEVGVGVKSGGQYGMYWVAEFGCPR